MIKFDESSDGSTCGFTYEPGTRPSYPFVFVPAFGKRPVGKFKELTETSKRGWKGKTQCAVCTGKRSGITIIDVDGDFEWFNEFCIKH